MGTTWEGAIMTVELYESRSWNEKYYPILLEAGAHLFVPAPLKPWDNNIVLTERERILRLLKDKQANGIKGFQNSTEQPALRVAAPKTLLPNSALPPNNLPNKNSYFTGREQILEDIRRQFKTGQTIPLRQTVAGLGGVGKTQIAIEYAYRYAGDYDDIWWVNAESGPQEAYCTFAREKGLLSREEDANWPVVLEAVRSWFDQHTRFLFIFDNVENFELLSGCLPRSSGHVLITTRQGHNPEGAFVDVDKFNPSEAADFFRKRLEWDGGADAAELAERLGYLPLAMEQAAAYTKANRKSCRNYIELLEKYGLKVFDERSASAYGYKETVNITWQISFEKIGLESARQLLNLCAYFAPDEIPLSMLVEGRENFPKPLRTDIADELSLNRVVWELRKYSLVQEKDGLLFLHRLLQEVVRDGLGGNTEWLSCCLNMACAVFKYEYGNKSLMNVFEQNVSHVLAIASHAEKVLGDEEAQKKTSGLYRLAGFWFVYGAKYSKAMECFQKTSEISEKVVGKKHPETATAYNNIAGVYDSQGDYAKALEWLQRALGIWERVLDYPAIVATHNDIAGVYCHQGDHARAMKCYQKALEMCDKVCREEHLDTVATYSNIAGIYDCQKDYTQAMEWYRKGLGICEKVCGDEHLDTVVAYSNIAGVYCRQKDHARALEYYQKALGICEKIWGKEHPDTATLYNNIALVYATQGDFAQAMKWHEKALAIREKALGKEHPDTAALYNNIALVYSTQGDCSKALEWYQKALAIREKALGKEHPDTVATYSNIALVYANQGDHAKAQEWLQKALAIRETVDAYESL